MPKKPKSIPQLFEAREKVAHKATDNIFAAMPGAMEAINEMMGLEEIKKIGGDIIWDDISLVTELVDEPLIVLVGIIVFPPGCELETTDGDKIKVTTDTEPYFRKLVRAGLPASVAALSKEEVHEYFKKMEQEMEESMKNLVTEDSDFDLTQLTEEQRAAYEASSAIKIGKA